MVALGEVGAGAEAAPAARDEKRPDGGVPLGLLQRRGEAGVHFEVEGVQALRPVERDALDARFDANEDGGHAKNITHRQ